MVIWIWVVFIAFVLAMLALDLGVFNRKAHVVGIRESLAWTGLWVALALIFNVLIYFLYEHNLFGIGQEIGHQISGRQAALDYFAGYIIEKSLSLDNIFVIALIFSYFRVPAQYQHRVLFWGILGALVMRGAMIAAGIAMIRRFEWITYVFGALLIATAIRMFFSKHENIEPEHNPLVRIARRVYPVSKTFDGKRFFTRIDGRRAITPLFLVLLVVESSDVLFAIDSIPAIFAITRDPFLVFTSNVFAILGLRSLYFALAGMLERFQYLKTSLVFILAFVGVKMILANHYHLPTSISLGVIAGLFAVGLIASLIATRRTNGAGDFALADEVEAIAAAALKHAKRVIVVIVGSTVLLAGIALLVLPGPAFVVIPAGLAILATEFVWARRLLRRIRNEAGSIGKALIGKAENSKQPSSQTPKD